MSEIVDERYAFASALRVENPAVGNFFTKGLYTGIDYRKLNGIGWLPQSLHRIYMKDGELDP
jgi:hypothetical protein